MESLSSQTKLKICLIIVISNILVYLIFSATPSIPEKKLVSFELRNDYVFLTIRSKLRTTFNRNKAISIINSKQTDIIKHAILIAVNTSSSGPQMLSESYNSEQQSITVYTHKSNLKKLLSFKDSMIVPFDSISVAGKRKKRVSYDLSI